MKKHIVALLAVLIVAPAFAAEQKPGGERPVHEGDIPVTFSSTLTYVSDFVDRGQSASDEHSAVQTEFLFTHDSGVYVGTWASGIDFNDNQSKVEVDYFVGYEHDLGDGWALDVNAMRYTYPDADETVRYDFYELTAGLTYDFDVAVVNTYFSYSPDEFGDSGEFYYLNLNADVPLPNDFSIGGEVAYSDINDEVRFASPDYTHWRLGVGYDWEGTNLRLDYHDTDVTRTICPDLCGPRFAFSVARSF